MDYQQQQQNEAMAHHVHGSCGHWIDDRWATGMEFTCPTCRQEVYVTDRWTPLG